ncbi:MAG: hypothetical protein ACRDJW_02820 [Thermomicrobiales bacterium]
MDTGPDTQLPRIAAFLAQALDLEDDPNTLATELRALKRDANAGIWTIELDSSVGPAAFLVYHYQLSINAEDGRSGQELFDADLAILEQTSERGTPGPRILAHALADDEAYILATTPATYRALSGEASASDDLDSVDTLPPSSNPDHVRREAASELLTLLQSANDQARLWLSAIAAHGANRADEPDEEIAIEFNDEEAALALFLLDDRGMPHVLRTLNLLIESAHRHASIAARQNPPERSRDERSNLT